MKQISIFKVWIFGVRIVACFENQHDNFQWNFSGLWALVFGPFRVARETKSPEPMKVINIGLPRTSTSSFVTALSALGLRSYHYQPGMRETVGHFDMWRDHVHLAFDDKTQSFNPDWQSLNCVQKHRDEMFDRIAQDGFTATADNPLLVWHKDLIERYPDAYIILGEHPNDASGWADSFLNTIGHGQQLAHSKPWKWFGTVEIEGKLDFLLWTTLGLPSHGEKRSLHFLRDELEEFYNRWNKEAETYVKSLNPKRKFLKFKACDGWNALCTFLAPLDKLIEKQCDHILISKLDYPRSNINLKLLVDLLLGISWLFEVSPLMPLIWLFLLLALVVYLYNVRWRSTRKDKFE